MSRVFSKPDFYSGVRGMLPAAVALVPFGLVCGVDAAAVGASPLAAFGLSAIVFSGAAQILATQLYAAGTPLAVIVLTCFVIGLRLAMYSAAMAPHLGPFPRVGDTYPRSCSPIRRLLPRSAGSKRAPTRVALCLISWAAESFSGVAGSSW